MKKEIEYFCIGDSYGGSQDWFSGVWMRMGGCAAETACDSSIYMALYKGQKKLYPYDVHNLTKADYVKFSRLMKPYLHPRLTGIDRLEIYVDGFGKYMQDRGDTEIKLLPWAGENDASSTRQVIKEQINKGYPIPYLLLKHNRPEFKDYVWHWFLLTDYEESDKNFFVKAVTYGSWQWLNFSELWETGHKKKGGLIIFNK